MRLLLALRASALSLLALASCSGGGGQSSGAATTGSASNRAPVLQVPSDFTGGPTAFGYYLPTTSAATLTFTATDEDGDPLLWQVSASAAAATSAGLVYSPSVSGSTLVMELQEVGEAEPAVALVGVRVEDPAGASVVVDLVFVRSASLTLTGVSPSSAFRSAPQELTLTGSEFLVEGNVGVADNSVLFQGGVGSAVYAVDDNTLQCFSPSGATLGGNTITVLNQYSEPQALAGAFDVYAYPVDLLAGDAMLTPACAAYDVASAGGAQHLVWTDGVRIYYDRSLDGGANWLGPQAIDQAGVSGERDEPQVAADGSTVVVAWQQGDAQVFARTSTDGGETFADVDALFGGGARDLQVCVSTPRVYCSWVDVQQSRISVVASGDQGMTWSSPNGFGVAQAAASADSGGYTVGCDGASAWVAYGQIEDPVTLNQEAGLWMTHTSDGGETWAPSSLCRGAAASVSSVTSCNTDELVYVAWVEDGALASLRSDDAGQTWSLEPEVLSPVASRVSRPVLACEGERLFAAYVVDSPLAVGVARVTSWGGSAEHTQITDSAGVVPGAIGQPALAQVGNYVFVAYREAPLAPASGAAPGRVKLSSSVDMGQTFLPAEVFGDFGAGGAAAGQSGIPGQSLPRVMIDGARVWLGWLDDRQAPNGVRGLYQNRTEK